MPNKPRKKLWSDEKRRRIRSNARTGKTEAKDQFEVEAPVVRDGIRASHRSRMGIEGFAAIEDGHRASRVTRHAVLLYVGL